MDAIFTQETFTKDILVSENILYYHLLNTSRETVDIWSEDLREEMMNWPDDAPLRMILHVEIRGSTISSYAIKQARRLTLLRPDVDGKLALVIENELTARVINFAVNQLNNSHRMRRVFTTYEDAIDWVLQD